jgi:hypothetical protein
MNERSTNTHDTYNPQLVKVAVGEIPGLDANSIFIFHTNDGNIAIQYDGTYNQGSAGFRVELVTENMVRVANIQTINVEPKGEGLGKQLLESLLGCFTKLGIHEVQAASVVNMAESFWQKNGFVKANSDGSAVYTRPLLN